MAMEKARVLVAFTVLDQLLNPNQVIEADEAIIKGLADQVDRSPEAVAYCLNNGGKIMTIQFTSAEDDLSEGKENDPPAGKEADQSTAEAEKSTQPKKGK
ncbi:hypothetical protein [Nitrosomonas eutropha]|uniref:Uncharacterized protein n=1 Tax=Nitrosomonas eutropha TaxID=916 RepID=A0ABX5MBR6_9PROT|nr:hypothetical protein [Nitrosomonas eutropha]PXV82487.1 hypothetical protein C8R14_10759 [Nitrosomonas eutropha]